MSLFTAIGTGLWSWEPFKRLERHHEDVVGRCSKLFWIALYTTQEAKTAVPGMCCGSITAMADAARVPVDAARLYLDRLIDDDLVEYDIERRVLRMTVLPDCGESPRNGSAIRGWWRRFQNVPECTVRDNHVLVLRWILDEWCRRAGKPLSKDHAEAWSDTFARVPVPAPRRRVPRHVQTDLFSASPSQKPEINTLDTNKGSTRVEQDPDTDPDTDLDQGSGSEGGVGGRPVLRLIPASPVDADDLAEMFHEATGGKFPLALTRKQRIALGVAIEVQASCIPTRDVLDVLRDYVKHSMPGFDPPRDTLTAEERVVRSRGITPECVVSPGWLSAAIQRATAWRSSCTERIEMAQQARRELGYEDE